MKITSQTFEYMQNFPLHVRARICALMRITEWFRGALQSQHWPCGSQKGSLMGLQKKAFSTTKTEFERSSFEVVKLFKPVELIPAVNIFLEDWLFLFNL